MSTFRESMQERRDWDLAAYELAMSIGLMPEGIFQVRGKHVFWTNNPIGNMLHSMLNELVAEGILEKREEPDTQFRWNAAYRGTWE